MKSRRIVSVLLIALLGLALAMPGVAAVDRTPSPESPKARQWRSEHRLIDLHQHINSTAQHLARAVSIMDAVGIGISVNLSGGYTTHPEGQPSPFQKNKDLADRLHPGRFLLYMNLDYSRWDEPDFSAQAVKQIEEGHRLGAAGLKEFKRLGLYLKDKAGKLIKIDDPKLDPVWKRCGELGMPVSIHVADPKAFWLPYDSSNERWTELKDHRNWWFGDPAVYPPREELLNALDRVIERNPKTTFVCVHFANNSEDLDWVERTLDRRPNMNADLAARIPEIGRHDPAKVRRLFEKHQDRIFFATDFQVYDRLTLGSDGSGPAPADEDARSFYSKHWRWLESNDRNFAHMTPIQGDWTISGIGLPDSVLRKIYFDNARKILASSMPLPVALAVHIAKDIPASASLSRKEWQSARPIHLEYHTTDASARPAISTEVRLLWSDKFLYISYASPFTELTFFTPADPSKERMGLWDKDVVEAFINADKKKLTHYTEFELAPNKEKLDLVIDLPKKDFPWSSRFETDVKIDNKRKVWTGVMKIPLGSLSPDKPKAGDRWRANFYRIDRASKTLLAWNPTLTGSYHTVEKLGILEFAELPR